MDVDVIILSKTSTPNLFNVLKDTVASLHASETDVKFNIIIVESNKNIKQNFGLSIFDIKAKFVIPPVPTFNYNQFLNIGLRECKSDYIVISNNDVIYYKNWFTEIKKQFDKDSNLLSASPRDEKWHKHSTEHFDGKKEVYIGDRIAHEFTGWCFVMQRKIIERIGVFDETFDFYYQDNDWVELYKIHNIKHGLVYNSHCHHLLSKSLEIIKRNDDIININKQYAKFYNKWNDSKRNKMYKRLSILICTIEGREKYLERLVHRLKPQVTPEVEVLVAKDNCTETIGAKRNSLLHKAIGEYVVFIDDDDWVSENYINKILKATDTKPDVIGFNSVITFNGEAPRRVEITLKHKSWTHKTAKVNGVDYPTIYYRCPNHLSPIKKSIATQIMFPEISQQEDRFFSLAIPTFAKTEVYIDEYLYFYDCRNPKRQNVSTEDLLKELESEKKFIENAEKTSKIES